MANTKKKTEEVPSVGNEELLALIQQMKQTMDAQAAEIEKLKGEAKEVKSKTTPKKKKSEKPKYVTITSLTNSILILRGGNRSYWINPYKSEKVSVAEAMRIVDNYMFGLENGVYTVDQWLIDENEWFVDETVCSHEEMANFFNLPVDEAIALFYRMSATQRGDIIASIETKIRADGKFERIDIASKIGDIVGKNFIKMIGEFSVDE